MQLSHRPTTSRSASIVRSATYPTFTRCLARSSKSLSIQAASMQQLDKQANFDAMCSMLGGLDPQGSIFTGYAGRWRTWELEPQASDRATPEPAKDADYMPSAPGQPRLRLIDDSTNLRLWRFKDPAAQLLQQTNLYQNPTRRAAPSTRFGPYLKGNTTAGRPDGYGTTTWTFGPDSNIVDPDASSWLGGKAEGAIKALSVAGQAAAIVNGSLPRGFEEGHTPPLWVLELIIKAASSNQRRWGTMAWYEAGELVVTHSIVEDRITAPADLEGYHVNPAALAITQQREGPFCQDLDIFAATQLQHKGTATAFELTPGSKSITRTTRPCYWADHTAGPGQLLTQHVQDGTYLRIPRSIKQAVESQSNVDTITFDCGTLLPDGSLGRWLLVYCCGGDRLLQAAIYEHYLPVDQHGSR